MFRLVKKVFIMLLSFSGSLASIVNQPCLIRPALIDLNADEYNQGFTIHLSLT